MNNLVILAAIFAFYFVAGKFIIGPIIIYFKQRVPASPDFHTIEQNLVPPFVLPFFSNTMASLTPEGFKAVAFLYQGALTSNTGCYVMVMENESKQDSAIAAVVFVKAGNTVKQTSLMVEFFAGFSDESSITVNNSSQPGVFKEFPERVIRKFPEIADPVTIYRIYLALLGRSNKWGRKSYIGHDPAALMRESTVREMERQVKGGYFVKDDLKDAYKPTVAGAILMTWKLLWPIKQILAARNASLNKKLLKELRFQRIDLR